MYKVDRNSMCCHQLMCKHSLPGQNQPGMNHEMIVFNLKCQQSKDVMSSKQLPEHDESSTAAKVAYLIFVFY